MTEKATFKFSLCFLRTQAQTAGPPYGPHLIRQQGAFRVHYSSGRVRTCSRVGVMSRHQRFHRSTGFHVP